MACVTGLENSRSLNGSAINCYGTGEYDCFKNIPVVLNNFPASEEQTQSSSPHLTAKITMVPNWITHCLHESPEILNKPELFILLLM